MNIGHIIKKMREYDGRLRFEKMPSHVFGEDVWKLVLYSDDCCFRTAYLYTEDELEFEDVIDAYIARMEEELSMRNGDHDERC